MSGRLGDPTFDPDKPPEALEADRDPNNAANEYAIAAKKRKKKLVDLNLDQGLKDMLASDLGRDWLSFLLFEVCLLDSVIENAAHDSNALHFREGARQVGLIVQAQAVRANPEGYMALLRKRLIKKEETQ